LELSHHLAINNKSISGPLLAAHQATPLSPTLSVKPENLSTESKLKLYPGHGRSIVNRLAVLMSARIADQITSALAQKIALKAPESDGSSKSYKAGRLAKSAITNNE
tara:strand:- start:3496 stop:3816 length:321 start_codon:yes stop_codon:yes gene_type:complete